MVDFKRKAEDNGQEGPIKRLRSSQQPSDVIPMTPVAQQFSPRPSPATSQERIKTGAASEIPDDGSIIAETEYGGDEHIPGTFWPSQVGGRSSDKQLKNRDDESVIAETEYGDEEHPAVVKQKPFALREVDRPDKSKMLEKVGLRGNLVYEAQKAGAPVIAYTHQLKDMMREGSAKLEDKKEQDAILNAHLPPEFAEPPKNKIFMFKEKANGWAVYEELPIEIYKKLSSDEKQYLGLLPDWGLTDREMFDLGLIEEKQLSRISREELQVQNLDRSRFKNTRAPQSADAGNAAENEPARNVSQAGSQKVEVVDPDDFGEFNDDILNDIDWSQFEGPRKQSQPENFQGHWQLREADLYLLHPSDDRLIDAMEASMMYLDQPSPDKLVVTKSEPDHLRLTASGSAALGDVQMIVAEANGSYGLIRSEGTKVRSFEEWTAKHGKNGVFLRHGGDDFLSIDRYNSIHRTMYQRDAAGARFSAVSGRSSRVDLPPLMVEDDKGDFVGIHDYLNQPDAHSLHKKNIVILSPSGKALHNPWVSKKQNLGYFQSLKTSEQVADLLDGYDQFRHTRNPLPVVLVRMGDKLVKAEKLNVLDYPKEDLFLLNHKEGRYTSNYTAFSKYSTPMLEQAQILERHPPTKREAADDAAKKRGLDPAQHSRNRSR